MAEATGAERGAVRPMILNDETFDAVVAASVDVLRRGELVILPTDTVYGLAARAGDEAAVRAVFAAKGRSEDKRLPLLDCDASALTKLAPDAPPAAFELAAGFWPGALTIVVPAGPKVQPWLRDERGAVAIRCPDNDLVRKISRELAEPVAATSANLAGMPDPVRIEEVPDELRAAAGLVVEGEPGAGVPSTVVECMSDTPVVVRQGAVRLP